MAHSQKKQRLLIFVIAYHAEGTLKWVLERIPQQVFDTFDTEVLIVDDASADRTFEIGHEYHEAHPDKRLTVLRNEYNQGYGGNQKVGYTFAITEGFDFVAMVHGDGQYAPEELPRLMEPLANGQADAVFGSRMTTAFGALKGGMPLYKYVGNRVLSMSQNLLLGTKLSEFHSGYRIYATRALEQVNYKLNSNDFHFDTEIIIQLLNAGQRIQELPIPTYYGDEICRVNGMKYAKDVMVATTKNVLHRSGLFWQRRFEPVFEKNAHYDLKLGYTSSHQLAIDAVPAGAKVVDVGAGPGGVPSELARKGCEVLAVDQHAPEQAPADMEVTVQDLDGDLSFDIGDKQYILMLDVIEHLKNPEGFLDKLRAQFTHEKKTLVLTTPNIAFLPQRLMLLLGQFNYGKAGILDRTHTRLFTFRTLEQLLSDAGFRVRVVKGVPAPFPKVLGLNPLGLAVLKANELAIALSKTLFSYQIYIEAESTPDVEFVLRDTREKSTERAARLRGEDTAAKPKRDEGARARKRPTRQSR